MEKFSQRIKQLRKEKRMTQEELGKKLGVTKTAISYWENNKTKSLPSFETLKNISEVFDVSMGYIVGFTDERWNI